MSKVKYTPWIIYKGLAIVLIPFVLGTFILLALNSLWVSSQKILNEENKQCYIIRILNDALLCWSTASATAVDDRLAVAAKGAQAQERKSSRIEWFFFNLKLRTLNDPRARGYVSRLELLNLKEAKVVTELPNLTTAEIGLETVQKMPKVLARLYKVRTEIGTLLKTELDSLQRTRLRTDRAMNEIKRNVLIYFFINVALALALVIMFSRQISSRFFQLMKNANCLPAMIDFPESLRGNDELSYLNSIMNETLGRLREAAEHRKSIIGMVAHDMRSPLMASLTSLQLFEECDYGFSDEEYAKFEGAYKNLESILEHVKAILTTQKTNSDGSLPLTESARFTQMSNQQMAGSFFVALRKFLLEPKIFQKGLLLVFLPLLIQTATLTYLSQQIDENVSASKVARKLSDSLSNEQMDQLNLVRGAIAHAIYVFSSNESADKLALKIFNQLNADMKQELLDAKDDPSELGSLQERISVMQKQIGTIMTVKPSDPPDRIASVFEQVSEVNEKNPEAYRMRRERKQRNEKEAAKLQSLEFKRARMAELLTQSFHTVLAFNLMFSVALFLLFLFDFTRRLDVLIRNATRLGRRERLIEKVKGIDELAYLDLSLHSAGINLELAAEERKTLMNSLANEMRRPLQTAFSQLNDFNELGVNRSDREKGLITKSTKNIQRVLGLISNLLTMEDLHTGTVHLEVEATDIKDLIEEALQTVAPLAGVKKIILKNESTDCAIQADKEKLVQVLINLLSNAIKFSGESTTITVKSTVSSEKVRVEVIDQGPGMDEETCNKVFEKFFQAKTEQKSQGFGLGLAICKLIIESHHGSLNLSSKVGVGSTFFFEIPKTHSSLQK